jgi:hypothetical protein
MLNTANRNDEGVALELLDSLKQWDMEFALGDVAYDSEKIRQTVGQTGILFISPSIAAIERNGKVPMVGFFLSF